MEKTNITATRFHDFSCGHRVVGHEGKCRFMHGHNYRVHFTLSASPGLVHPPVPGFTPRHNDLGLDSVGRVLDFSVIKSKVCQWLEDNWDHKFLAWEEDKMLTALQRLSRLSVLAAHKVADSGPVDIGSSVYLTGGVVLAKDAKQMMLDLDLLSDLLLTSVVWVSFNPTAENMAGYLLDLANDELLDGTGCRMVKVVVEETRKCSATAEL